MLLWQLAPRTALLPRLTAFSFFLAALAAFSAEPQTGWTEVRTPHVTLKTDLQLDEAGRAALAIERTRSGLLAAVWPGMKLLQVEHIEMVVFRDHPEFQRYFGDRLAGLFVHGAYPPLGFLSGTADSWEHRETLALPETTSILKHELTHHLAAYFYRRQPRWFSEGMAEFFETMRFSEDGKTATLGDANLQAWQSYNRARSVTVADAMAWSGKLDEKDQATTGGLYGVSWLMVDWLYNTRPQDFDRYQTLLVKGIDPDKAWKAVFPDLKPADLDTQLQQYIQVGSFRNISVAVPPVDPTVREQPMTLAEVHATRATALAAGSMDGAGPPVEAKAEIDAALAEDPANVRALQLKLGTVSAAERPALGRRATAAHPEDGVAWLLLAASLPDTAETFDERAQAYRKATELVPDNPTAFNNLAWMQLQKGRAMDALPLALTAVRMAPWDSAFLDTLAEALVAAGRCTEAMGIQTRAVEMLPERSTAAVRALYAGRLASFQTKCSEASTVTPTPAAGAPSSKP